MTKKIWMQIATVNEGQTYLQMMFQTMTNPEDTVRRLFIVAAASYDDYLRKNNSRLYRWSRRLM